MNSTQNQRQGPLTGLFNAIRLVVLCLTGVAMLATTCPGALPLEPADGTCELFSREDFEAYADRNNFPGAMQVLEVKFVMTGVDGDEPVLYFQNTRTYAYHYDFVVEALGWNMDLQTFNNQTYFSDGRCNLAGSLIAYDDYAADANEAGIYGLEFWPTDPVSFRLVTLAYHRIIEAVPFAADKIFYHPAGETQRALYQRELEAYETSDVRAIQTEELFAEIGFTAMNPGEAYGRLRIMDSVTSTSIRDIVLFKTLPNALGHVAGIITEIPQTPLSHVNLKAKQNNTPNAYIRDASEDPNILQWADAYVHYKVTAAGYSLEAATSEQVDAFLEDLRPDVNQVPPRDLSVTEIRPLSKIAFADSDVFGAKAANVAELRRILPDGQCPDGYAVPFSFYHAFMTANGFYDRAEEMIADSTFQTDVNERSDALKQFRKTLRKAEVPTWISTALAAMYQSYPQGTSLRCRSSTNNEDLPDFNGAGLYDSYTHHPDEGDIDKSIKQVWASLWNDRAFDEREFYRIDHLTAAMGVLVHPNYTDEQVNGVAVTQNIYDPNWLGYYVNAQLGEDLVTNPEEESLPEEFLVADLIGEEPYEIQYIRWSNQIPAGETLMSKSQIYELADLLELVQTHFARLYEETWNPYFAMEVEFKITDVGILVIKQARPWID